MARKLKVIRVVERNKKAKKRKAPRRRVVKRMPVAPRTSGYIIEAQTKIAGYHFYYWTGSGYSLDRKAAKVYATEESATAEMKRSRPRVPRGCKWVRVFAL